METDAFVQLVIRTRLWSLRETRPDDPKFAKYDRQSLIRTYDCLFNRKFANLSVEDFPLRTKPPVRKTQRSTINMNEDSDGSFGENFGISEESIKELRGNEYQANAERQDTSPLFSPKQEPQTDDVKEEDEELDDAFLESLESAI